MAVVADRVVVELEARLSKYEADVRRARSTFDQSMKSIGGSAQQAERRVQSSVGAIGTSLRLLGGLAAGAAATTAIRMADGYTRMTNSLKVAGLEGENATRVLKQLADAADRQAAPVQNIVQLYGRMAMSQQDLGASTADLMKVSEGVAASLKISGSSAESAGGALMQLSQALSGGIVRAEEFNSILEGMPDLARAIARAIPEAEGSIGKLRKMMIDGKLSSQEMFQALLRASDGLIKTSAGSATTVGQAMTRIGNAAIMAVGEFDKLTGASETLVGALISVAEAIKTIGGASTWTFDKIEKLHNLMVAMGLGDPVERNRVTTSGPASLTATAVQQGMQAKLDALKKEAGETVNQISELNFNLDEGLVGEGHIEAARKEVERLQEQFRMLGEEIKRIELAMTGMAGVHYDPLSSIQANGVPKPLPQAIRPLTTSMSAQYIASKESFRPNAYWDVNHWRAGYGSDTMTDTRGRSHMVNERSTTTVADATRDLLRRVAQAEQQIVSKVGAEAFNKLSEGARAALTSVTYNYGQLPDRLVGAVKSGDPNQIAAGIERLGTDNEGVNMGRRREEAALAAGKDFAGAYADVTAEEKAASDAAADIAKESADAAADLAASKEQLIKGAERNIEALGLEARAFGQSTYEAERAKVAFDLMNQAKDADLEITPELTEKINELAAAYANASVAVEEAAIKQEEVAASEEELIARADELRNLSNDVLGGFINDLVSGKTAAEALAGALGKIAQKLIDIGVNALTESLFGGFGTALGGVFGGGGGTAATVAHSGGRVGSIGTSRMVPPSVFSGAAVMHDGGPVLKPGEVPIIAQEDEWVLKKGMRPSDLMKAGTRMVNNKHQIAINLEGANGDETIRRIAYQAAHEGSTAAIMTAQENVGNWSHDQERRKAGNAGAPFGG